MRTALLTTLLLAPILAIASPKPYHAEYAVSRNGSCQAQVEQRGAARDVDGATVRVAVPQRPCRVGVQLDSVSVAPDPEPPGLSVVHRWRCHGGIQQVGDHLLGQLPRPGR